MPDCRQADEPLQITEKVSADRKGKKEPLLGREPTPAWFERKKRKKHG